MIPSPDRTLFKNIIEAADGNVEQETLQIIVSKRLTNVLVKPFNNDDIENKVRKVLVRGMKAKAA